MHLTDLKQFIFSRLLEESSVIQDNFSGEFVYTQRTVSIHTFCKSSNYIHKLRAVWDMHIYYAKKCNYLHT